MSKNQKPMGQQELKVLTVTEPAVEVVSAIKEAMQELPEYAVLMQVADIQSDIERKQGEEDSILGNETFDALKSRIRTLSNDLEVRVSKTKAASLNGEIALVRNSILEVKRLAQWLEEQAIAKLQEDPNHVRELGELAKAVAAAKRIHELRNAKQSLEKEAQDLLVSANLA
jgi:hypothetical protein